MHELIISAINIVFYNEEEATLLEKRPMR